MTGARFAVMVAARTLAGLLLAAGAAAVALSWHWTATVIGVSALVAGLGLWASPVCSSWQSKPAKDQP